MKTCSRKIYAQTVRVFTKYGQVGKYANISKSVQIIQKPIVICLQVNQTNISVLYTILDIIDTITL